MSQVVDIDNLVTWAANPIWDPNAFASLPIANALNAIGLIQALVIVCLNSVLLWGGFNANVGFNAANQLSLVLCAGHLSYGVFLAISKMWFLVQQRWDFAHCVFDAGGNVFFISVSQTLLMLISVERFLCILKSIKLNSHQVGMAVFNAVVVVGLGNALFHLISVPRPFISASGLFCQPNFGGDSVFTVIFTWIDLVVMGANVGLIARAPNVVVYSIIVRKLRLSFKKLNNMSSVGAKKPVSSTPITASVVKSTEPARETPSLQSHALSTPVAANGAILPLAVAPAGAKVDPPPRFVARVRLASNMVAKKILGVVPMTNSIGSSSNAGSVGGGSSGGLESSAAESSVSPSAASPSVVGQSQISGVTHGTWSTVPWSPSGTPTTTSQQKRGKKAKAKDRLTIEALLMRRGLVMFAGFVGTFILFFIQILATHVGQRRLSAVYDTFMCILICFSPIADPLIIFHMDRNFHAAIVKSLPPKLASLLGVSVDT
ncbi:hypothetical protein BC828DRAFT_284773 [Blastocladiella britannica]|nr:hypothetical protein BC828DRAFT_284773 [Blastocladiella britannica]